MTTSNNNNPTTISAHPRHVREDVTVTRVRRGRYVLALRTASGIHVAAAAELRQANGKPARGGKRWGFYMGPHREAFLDNPTAAGSEFIRPTLGALREVLIRQAAAADAAALEAAEAPAPAAELELGAYVTLKDGSIEAELRDRNNGNRTAATIRVRDRAQDIQAAARQAAAYQWTDSYQFSSSLDFPREYGWRGRNPHRVLEEVLLTAATILASGPGPEDPRGPWVEVTPENEDGLLLAGAELRSQDFEGRDGRPASSCYIEGVVAGVDQYGLVCFHATRRVWKGQEETPEELVGTLASPVMTPTPSTWRGWPGRLQVYRPRVEVLLLDALATSSAAADMAATEAEAEVYLLAAARYRATLEELGAGRHATAHGLEAPEGSQK